MAERVPQILIGTLAAGAVVLGIYATGGPARGRADRRDEDRQADIRALAEHVHCLSRETGALPDNLTPTDACKGDRIDFKDEAGKPYTYKKVSADEYQVCAAYEYPEDIRDYFGGKEHFDRTTGCHRFDKN